MHGLVTLSLLVLCVAIAQAASVAKPSCGATASSKNIQLLTPSNPPVDCVYTIKATSSYVCQLRIDFTMNLAQPAIVSNQRTGVDYAECQDDVFKVHNLRLCGVETQQHIYVPLNRSAGITTVDLSFKTASRAGGSQLEPVSWDVLITQLECPTGASVRNLGDEQIVAASVSASDGFLVAPPGCLQYFPDISGTVTSFNLNNGRGIYPANLNYAICFRRDTRTAGLQMKTTYFHIGDASNAATTLETDKSCFTSNRVDEGTVDYLMVPQASLWETDTRATYFCGNSAKTVTIRSTSPGPLYVLFNSDGIYRQNEAGFSFTYNIL